MDVPWLKSAIVILIWQNEPILTQGLSVAKRGRREFHSLGVLALLPQSEIDGAWG